MLFSKDTISQYLVYAVLDSIIQIIHSYYFISFTILFIGSMYSLLIWREVGYVLFVISILLYCFTNIISGRSIQDSRVTKYYKQSWFDPHNVAVLCLNEDSPYENGKSHGIMMKDDILKMVRWYSWLWTKPVDTNVIPDLFLSEMQGIVDGVNSKSKKSQKISVQDLLKVYYVADTYSACTCIGAVINNKWVFGRNMDWIPFQMAHKSIIIRYKDGLEILTAPGVIGLITGWKGNLRMAMNVCPDPKVYKPNSMPTILYNRSLILMNNNIEEIKSAIQVLRPRNAYHLTVSDGSTFCSIAMYQQPDDTDFIRDKSPVFVVNDSKTGVSAFLSRRRLDKLEKMKFTHVNDIIDGLVACKSFETVHTVVFNGYDILIGIDNGYSTDQLVQYK